jgi:hypothetical protein
MYGYSRTFKDRGRTLMKRYALVSILVVLAVAALLSCSYRGTFQEKPVPEVPEGYGVLTVSIPRFAPWVSHNEGVKGLLSAKAYGVADEVFLKLSGPHAEDRLITVGPASESPDPLLAVENWFVPVGENYRIQAYVYNHANGLPDTNYNPPHNYVVNGASPYFDVTANDVPGVDGPVNVVITCTPPASVYTTLTEGVESAVHANAVYEESWFRAYATQTPTRFTVTGTGISDTDFAVFTNQGLIIAADTLDEGTLLVDLTPNNYYYVGVVEMADCTADPGSNYFTVQFNWEEGGDVNVTIQ